MWWRRLFGSALVLWPLWWGCGGATQECKEGVSNLSLNPSGSSCVSKCDCNNQEYTGYCVDGECRSTARGACEGRGTEILCRPLIGSCPEGQGVKVCQPDYLGALRWGDCTCTLCKEGEEQPCYSGNAGCKALTGGSFQCATPCAVGKRTCLAGGVWTSCQEDVIPKQEECNGVDDDCDGKVDGGLVRACRAACGQGEQACREGRWGPCTCRCEEGQKRPCYSGVAGCRETGEGFSCLGTCAAGVQTCQSDRQWSACAADKLPENETCNNRDDDCNGQIDDRLFQDCATKCGTGREQCIQGRWQNCTLPVPSREVCDGQDNNCDGKIDEELPSCLAVKLLAGGGNCRNTAQGPVDCYQDGAGSQARFYEPFGMVVDADGNVLIADSKNHRIRKLDRAGNVTTVAGDGKCVCPALKQCTDCYKDGPAMTAQFNEPMGLAVDKDGNLYIADSNNHRIRKLDRAGNVTTVAGGGRCVWSLAWKDCYKDGVGQEARFHRPAGLVIDAAGNLFIAEAGNTFFGGKDGGHRIRKLELKTGKVTTVAGSGEMGFKDGFGAAAQFNEPMGLAVDKEGNLYVADRGNHRIRKIDNAGKVTTFAGGDRSGEHNDIGDLASFSNPSALVLDATGNLYVADTFNHAIRRISKEGNVKLIAGGGLGKDDGVASQARFDRPWSLLLVQVQQSTQLWIAERFNHSIRALRLP